MLSLFKKKPNLGNLFVVTGAIGFFFSFLITVEKIALMKDAAHVPPCSINPFISCGTVMQTWQAELFGFPNPLIGIAGFAIILTIGFALLSGAQFKKWYWQGVQVGVTLAAFFCYWLFYQILYDIQALCLYCMAVWAATFPLFLYTTVYNVQEGNINLGKKINQLTIKYRHWILFLMYAVVVGLITYEFWDYWVGLF